VSTAREVRDLAWLLNTPSLLLNSELRAHIPCRPVPDFSLNTEVQTWLAQLQTQPAPLVNWVASQRDKNGVLRLGRYAERLLEFYLRHGPTHRLVAANLPLRRQTLPRSVAGAADAADPASATNHRATQRPSDHTTIGEIDFLVEDAHGQSQHWELAVKYFLCASVQPTAVPEDFIGPGGSETLRSKLSKLERQLSHTPPAPHDARQWQRVAFSRGIMFYRFGHAVPSCSALHAQHLKAWWLPTSELAQLPRAERWAVIQRHAWMSEFDAGLDTALFSGTAQQVQQWLREQVHEPAHAHPHTAHMLVALQDQREVFRCFAVPDDSFLLCS
jgi:uncharacterized protein